MHLPAVGLRPLVAQLLGDWPAGASYDCDHAGRYLLLPAMAELGLDTLVAAARYPGTKVLSSFHSLASLLLVKASRRGLFDSTAAGGRLPVVGGTGEYHGASGTLDFVTESADTFALTFNLED